MLMPTPTTPSPAPICLRKGVVIRRRVERDVVPGGERGTRGDTGVDSGGCRRRRIRAGGAHQDRARAGTGHRVGPIRIILILLGPCIGDVVARLELAPAPTSAETVGDTSARATAAPSDAPAETATPKRRRGRFAGG